ncbi:MAG: hypothetical protein HN742_02055 [Lentisphaerae bacterium]|jgi:hypothetical protein|nr:hypothetical protein [Lentisphaerota bacterium]MBT5611256.1 hypothetical protein [Lentisphaerota bacterium]MBT7059195.1 hypothetical protein [Lentisphaerota bacterium]MBT7840621.1 hypothetical protein [Lentisphaerota bacterium]
MNDGKHIRTKIARLALQALAIPIGLFGCFLLVMGAAVVIATALDGKYAVAIAGAVTMVPLGAYLLYVTVLVLRRFSTRSLKHLSAVLALLAMGPIGNALKPWIEDAGSDPRLTAVGVLPLVGIVLIYKVGCWLLPKLAETERSHSERIQADG